MGADATVLESLMSAHYPHLPCEVTTFNQTGFSKGAGDCKKNDMIIEDVEEEKGHTIRERPSHSCGGASTRRIRETWLWMYVG